MKHKKTTRSLGHGWRVTKSGDRNFYSYHGKRKSKESYSKSRVRRNTRSDSKGKKHRKTKRAGTSRRVDLRKQDFCKLKTRKEFYERVLADRKKYRDKIGEEEASGLQLWFQIGDGQKRRKKSDKRLQYTHGLRKFVNMKKAKMFLGIGSAWYEKHIATHPLPKWRRSGRNSVCQFEKKAWLVVTRSRGSRAIAPRILERYEIQEKFER